MKKGVPGTPSGDALSVGLCFGLCVGQPFLMRFVSSVTWL